MQIIANTPHICNRETRNYTIFCHAWGLFFSAKAQDTAFDPGKKAGALDSRAGKDAMKAGIAFMALLLDQACFFAFGKP